MAENPKKRPRGSEVDRTEKKRPSRSAEGLFAKGERQKEKTNQNLHQRRFSSMESPEGGDWTEVRH